jgi:hypothetical protein
MAKFKDFGSGTAQEQREPVSFKLHDEEFFGVNQLQGRVLLELIAKSSSEDAAISAQVISDFFVNVLTNESYKRFEALTLDKERIVTVETLSEIVSWLISEYSDRPEEQPENSSPGQ